MTKYLLAAALLTCTGCVSFPIPPTGQDTGKWGYVDIKIQYRPNFQTAIDFLRPNGDIPATLTDK